MDIARFLRNIAAVAVAAGIQWALSNLGLLHLPIFVIPIVASLLNAIADYLRNNFPPQKVGDKEGFLTRTFKAVF